jgi:hypothetical protein
LPNAEALKRAAERVDTGHLLVASKAQRLTFNEDYLK